MRCDLSFPIVVNWNFSKLFLKSPVPHAEPLVINELVLKTWHITTIQRSCDSTGEQDMTLQTTSIIVLSIPSISSTITECYWYFASRWRCSCGWTFPLIEIICDIEDLTLHEISFQQNNIVLPFPSLPTFFSTAVQSVFACHCSKKLILVTSYELHLNVKFSSYQLYLILFDLHKSSWSTVSV